METWWEACCVGVLTAACVYGRAVGSTNSSDEQSTRATLSVRDEDLSEWKPLHVAGVVALVLLLLLLPVFVLGFRKLRKVQKHRRELRSLELNLQNDPSQLALFNPAEPVNDQTEYMPYYVEFEIPRNRLQLGTTLGSGHFGKVLKGELLDPNASTSRTVVAVKMLKDHPDSAQQQAFIGEIKIMMFLEEHPNVVKFLGAVAKDAPRGRKMMMLMEYCPHGSLSTYLTRLQQNCTFRSLIDATGTFVPKLEQEAALRNVKHRRNALLEQNVVAEILSTIDLISYGRQVCSGMSYLHEKGVIHRDLAARNVLVADRNVVKIADFGLARQEVSDLYQRKNPNAELPWRWFAVESLAEGVSSFRSDVWSFAVLLWEIFSLGAVPYSGKHHDVNFTQWLRDGRRLSRAQYLPADVWSVVSRCWLTDPDRRPLFPQLLGDFTSLLAEVRAGSALEVLALDNPEDAPNLEHYVNDSLLAS